MSSGRSAPLDPQARGALRRVLELLASERASVSSVTEPERAWRVHIEDSLTGLEVPELAAAARIADIGSGAGFPGLVLAAALPTASVDLIESIGRKCDFMRRAIEAAGIANARVVEARSEELAAADGREAYAAVTARAVGRLSTLAELASPLLKRGRHPRRLEGKAQSRRREASSNAPLRQLAMRPERILDVGARAGSRHRHLHVLRKSGPTPSDLPRRPGIAKKRPRG